MMTVDEAAKSQANDETNNWRAYACSSLQPAGPRRDVDCVRHASAGRLQIRKSRGLARAAGSLSLEQFGLAVVVRGRIARTNSGYVGLGQYAYLRVSFSYQLTTMHLMHC